MKRNDYDEKQLFDRGTAYQYGFLSALATITAIYFLDGILSIKFSTHAAFSITLWVPMSVCLITFILKDAFIGLRPSNQRLLPVFLGICGLILTILDSAWLIMGRDALWINGEVSDNAGSLFCGICTLAVGITYLIKRHLDKKQYIKD